MSRVDLVVPDIGSAHDVDVVDVLVKPGDVVEVDTPLVTLETDKASMDVPSTSAGTVAEVLLKRGDKASAGTVIARVETNSQAQVRLRMRGKRRRTPRYPRQLVPQRGSDVRRVVRRRRIGAHCHAANAQTGRGRRRASSGNGAEQPASARAEPASAARPQPPGRVTRPAASAALSAGTAASAAPGRRIARERPARNRPATPCACPFRT